MSETITDAKGRVLTLRKIGVVEQLRMLRAIGPDQSANYNYVHLVECIIMVSEIDGVPLPAPTSERQIDANAQRLGDDGVAAVMIERMKQIKATHEAAEAAVE